MGLRKAVARKVLAMQMLSPQPSFQGWVAADDHEATIEASWLPKKTRSGVTLQMEEVSQVTGPLA